MQITLSRTAPVAASESMQRWISPGVIAGVAFLGFEMLVGAFTTSLWSFPQAIVQTVGLAAPTSNLEPAQLLAGMAMHMAFSIGLGALFIALAQLLHLRGRRLLAAGVLFMWLESGVTIWAVLHVLFPATLPIMFASIPFWASFVGRTGFGVVLALAYQRIWR